MGRVQSGAVSGHLQGAYWKADLSILPPSKESFLSSGNASAYPEMAVSGFFRIWALSASVTMIAGQSRPWAMRPPFFPH